MGDLITTRYLIRIEIQSEVEVPKDIIVKYLVTGIEHTRSARLGYEITVYDEDDFEIVDADSRPAPPSGEAGVPPSAGSPRVNGKIESSPPR